MRIMKWLLGISLFWAFQSAYAIVAVCNHLESYMFNASEDTLYVIFNTPQESQRLSVAPGTLTKIGDGGIDLPTATTNSATTIYTSDKYENDSQIFFSVLQKMLNDGPVTEKDFGITTNNYQIVHVVMTSGNCKKLIPGKFIYIVSGI